MSPVAAAASEDRSVEAATVARWLAHETRAREVLVTRLERLPGGAIQENWALDVTIDAGPWSGSHEWLLRTNARSSVAASRS